MPAKRTVVVILVMLIVLPIGYLLVPENYCFFNPSIDTHYAPGFTENKFSQIRVGMSHEEVIALVGEPMGGPSAQSSLRWHYTHDGKCTWKDWAWLSRQVVFFQGRVVEKVSRVYYD